MDGLREKGLVRALNMRQPTPPVMPLAGGPLRDRWCSASPIDVALTGGIVWGKGVGDTRRELNVCVRLVLPASLLLSLALSLTFMYITGSICRCDVVDSLLIASRRPRALPCLLSDALSSDACAVGAPAAAAGASSAGAAAPCPTGRAAFLTALSWGGSPTGGGVWERGGGESW